MVIDERFGIRTIIVNAIIKAGDVAGWSIFSRSNRCAPVVKYAIIELELHHREEVSAAPGDPMDATPARTL